MADAENQDFVDIEAISKLQYLEPIFAYDDIVIVLVGPDDHRFQIHKALICRYPFFKAAYEGQFRESDGTLKLPQQDPAIFRFFVYWLYTGRIDGYYYPSSASPSISEIQEEFESRKGFLTQNEMERTAWCAYEAQAQLYRYARYIDAPFSALIGLYLLAEYLLIPGLRDQIINKLIDVYSYKGYEDDHFWCWDNTDRPAWAQDPVPCINKAWRSSSGDSSLCRLLVTLFCDSSDNSMQIVQENEELDPKFMSAALAKAQKRWQRGMDRETAEHYHKFACKYHDHDGYPCQGYCKE
ncbi:MAG: hypothetical protein Q9213_000676 [Squamulea squamosa]